MCCFRFICCVIVVMSGTHFYLTLPSNASLNEFPNNKTTSYRVKLPQSIDLEGVWEVGLYSISYPNTWYTLQNGVDKHFYYADRTSLYQQAIVDYGYYQSMHELIKAANKALTRNVNDNIKLKYNAFTGKVTVHIKNGFLFAVVKPLSIILGFGRKDVILKKNNRKPLHGRLDDRINHLRILRHCGAPNRRRHERSITQKYSCRREVW